MFELQDRLDSVILSIGDMIVDDWSGFAGVLVRRRHRIDAFGNLMYFWDIKWIKNINRFGESPVNHPGVSNYIEEEGLKLSIVVEMIRHYPTKRGEHEF